MKCIYLSLPTSYHIISPVIRLMERPASPLWRDVVFELISRSNERMLYVANGDVLSGMTRESTIVGIMEDDRLIERFRQESFVKKRSCCRDDFKDVLSFSGLRVILSRMGYKGRSPLPHPGRSIDEVSKLVSNNHCSKEE